MRRTASSERAGVTVPDTWGGRWQVQCHRAGVLPAPVRPPGGDAVHRLLTPWGARAEQAPPPAASWVLGRSARWHGATAPGAGGDPFRDEALLVRNATGLGGIDLGGLARPLWGWRLLRTAREERTHPWLVQLSSAAGAARSATWAVDGPEAAQTAVTAVAEAVRDGRAPELPGARLLDVRDDRR
jgi:hypothetical protein